MAQNIPLVEQYYPESRFGGFTDLDGTIRFYTRICALLRPDMVVLDAGCGRGAQSDDRNDFRRNLRSLRGKCRKVVGLDIDPIGATNSFIDEFVQIDSNHWPVADCSVDLVVTDWVVEHLADPDTFLKECWRVLKPDGYLCIRTTNRIGYVGLMSSVMPSRLHDRIVTRTKKLSESAVTFPTHYRCNTPGKLRRLLIRNRFDCCVLAHEAEPSYLNFSRIAYHLGVAYQMWMPRSMGNTLIAFGQKLA